MSARCIAVTAVLIASCSGGGGDSASETDLSVPASEHRAADETSPPDTSTADVSELTIEELTAAASEPDLVAPTAERPCERYGFACSMADASGDQIETALAAMDRVATAIDGVEDAREQLRAGLAEVAAIEGATLVDVDVDTATMLSFVVDDGPRVSILTEAGELRDDGEVAPVDEAFVPQEDGREGLVRPQGLRRSLAPERYEPAGGPTNRSRRALVINPFEWSSAGEIAAIFSAEPEYTTVDQLDGSQVHPWAIDVVGSYDAVHIISHGGGSCPPWTDDRDECSSTFVGGPIDIEFFQQQQAAADSSVSLDFWLCESGGVSRYCFNSNLFPTNPNGITFFGSCGSDFGFNNTGAGASVGWTGTTQRRVAERTAVAFWTLMVEKGVEFRLAEEIVKGAGYDSHTTTWWASGGSVNFFTESVFAGRNLRARDVIEPQIDGSAPQGQVVQFNGVPEDGRPDTFPKEDQTVTLKLDGVRTGSEAAVQFEIRGDGTVWEADIDLVRDGTIVEPGDGYAAWLVTLTPDAVKMPDVAWADLSPSAAPIDLEVRAFENAAEYTAELGSIRLATDVVASGPLPIFDELAAAIAPAGGEVTGNDLRVEFNTAGGPVTGELHVAMIGQGIELGTWDLSIDGEYDPDSGSMSGTVVGQSQGGIGGVTAGDFGSGEFSGSTNLAANTVNLTLGIGGQSQPYTGTFVS